jgi:hypothetical protein
VSGTTAGEQKGARQGQKQVGFGVHASNRVEAVYYSTNIVKSLEISK